MELTVYLDVFWVRSFLMEICVCIFVNLWLKQGQGVLKIIAVCGICVMVDTLTFAIAGYGTIFMLSCLLLRMLELKILFRVGYMGRYVRMLFWSMFATVVLGGIMLWSMQQLGIQFWFPVGLGISSVMILVSVILEERRQLCDNRLYKVFMEYENHVMRVEAFYDTGNHLQDPYVHEPVLIVSEAAAGNLGLREDACRLIPFSTVGMSNGLIRVWTLDKLNIRETCIVHPVVGLADCKLFEGKDYQAILPAGWQCYL